MPIYKPCPNEVRDLAKHLLVKYATHKPVLEAEVKIDLLFAYPTTDEHGESKGDAIKLNGVKCLGLCRILPLKDRAKGCGDAEILLDGEWWEDASDEERMALLDHELHHISVVTRGGYPIIDDAGRPKLKLRKHDVQIGWFDIIADRHGKWSQERIQARAIAEKLGQLYWPEIMREGGLPGTIVRIDDREITVPLAALAGGVQ